MLVTLFQSWGTQINESHGVHREMNTYHLLRELYDCFVSPMSKKLLMNNQVILEFWVMI